MALNNRKIVTIILEECAGVEERCQGYRKELIETISDIIDSERGHRVSATNVQKTISDKCNASANFLARNRARDSKGNQGT